MTFEVIPYFSIANLKAIISSGSKMNIITQLSKNLNSKSFYSSSEYLKNEQVKFSTSSSTFFTNKII